MPRVLKLYKGYVMRQSKTLTIALILMLTYLGATGDREFVRSTMAHDAGKELTNPQKPCFLSWFLSVWPMVVAANVMTLECNMYNGDLRCRHSERLTETDDEYYLSEDNGLAHNGKSQCEPSESSGDITYCKITPWKTIAGVSKDDLVTCVVSVWPTAGSDAVAVKLWKGEHGGVKTYYHYDDSAGPADYVDLKNDGYVVRPTGIEE